MTLALGRGAKRTWTSSPSLSRLTRCKSIASADRRVERIASQAQKPTFADLERALSAMGSRSIANADWATRLRSEITFNVESAKPPPPQK